MRICLPTGIFPPDIGGPSSYVPQIAERLQAHGHTLEVITLADCPEEPLPSYFFAVHRLRRAQARALRTVRVVAKIFAVARRSDLVFANGLFIEAALASRLAHRPLTLKIVGDWAWERSINWGLTTDGLEDFQSRRQGLRAEFLKWLRSRVLRQATLVIVPSRYLGGIVRRWGVDSGRIVCIYNACEAPEAPTQSPLPPFKGTTLCTVARLVPWKGIGPLIHLVSDLPGTRLVIIGEGPLRASLEKQAQALGVRARVIFLGRKDRPGVVACLAASDLFVLNSTYEGLPHVILEAFASSIPVLATAVGGVPEVVEHGRNGWLVSAGEPAELRGAAQNLMANATLRRRLIKGARKTLTEKFSWPRLVVETEGALASTMRTGERPKG